MSDSYRADRPRGQTGYSDQNYRQGNRQSDYNHSQNNRSRNGGQSDYGRSRYGGQSDYIEGQNFRPGNRGAARGRGGTRGGGRMGRPNDNMRRQEPFQDYDGEGYGENVRNTGNRGGWNDYNEGQDNRSGNRGGWNDYNDGQDNRSGNRGGWNDYNEGQDYRSGNRGGWNDYNEGQDYRAGNRGGWNDYNEGQDYRAGNRGGCQDNRSGNRGGQRGRGPQTGTTNRDRQHENTSRQEQSHRDNRQENDYRYRDEEPGGVNKDFNRNRRRKGQHTSDARPNENQRYGNIDHGLLQTPTVHPTGYYQSPIGQGFGPPLPYGYNTTVPPPFMHPPQPHPPPPPPPQPQMAYLPPSMNIGNLRAGNPTYGSTMTLNDYSNKAQPNRRDNQQNRNPNQTNQRKGNLSRSTSTPAVNNAGARPKKFTEKRDYQRGQSMEQSGQMNDMGDKQRQFIGKRGKKNQHGGTEMSRTGHGPSPQNRMRDEEAFRSSSESLPDEDRYKQNEKPNKRRGERFRTARNGRGSMQRGGRLYDRNKHCGRGNHYADKKNRPLDDTDEGSRKLKDTSRQKGLRGFSGRYRGRGRLSMPYRGFVSKPEDEEKDDTDSSVFGSSWSLTSEVSDIVGDVEVSDIVGDVTDRNELKVDDLDVAPINTLKNREKRYKNRLRELKKKKENKDINKIHDFEKALESIREAINRRSRNSEPKEDEQAVESDQKQILEDENESTVNKRSTMRNTKGLKVGKQTKKSNFVASRKGQVVFKPKQNKNKQLKGRPAQKCTGDEMVSTSSSEETITSDKDEIDSDNMDKKKDEKGKTGDTPKRRRQRKRKTRKPKNVVEQEEDEHSQLFDVLDRLNNIGKKDTAPLRDKSPKRSFPPTDQIKIQSRKPKFPFSYEVSDANNTDKPEISEPTNSPVEEEKSNKTNDTENGPDVNEVFKFLVKHLSAEATPSDIVRESGLFPSDCNAEKWFRSHKNRFALIERDGRVVKVIAFNKELSYCLDYITKRSCTKSNCDRYHICKDLLCGNCHFGSEQCQFSHDLLDEEKNLSISKAFGYYNIFTSDEICSLLSLRFPRICMMWNENGSCENQNCTSLHICQRFVLGRCLEDKAACPLSHDKFSSHNKPIIDAYRMSKIPDPFFRRLIFIKRSVRPRNPSASNTDNQPDEMERIPAEVRPNQPDESKLKTRKSSGAGKKEKKKRDDISSLPDNLQDVYICKDNLTAAGCKNSKCPSLHLDEKLPYIWQIKAFGKWIGFHQSEAIEHAYCNRRDGATTDLEMDSNLYTVEVRFEPKLHAFLNMEGQNDGQEVVEVRRISTRSYMEKAYMSQSYKTQWRWYFRNDMREWELFEQNMQFTLEKKYLAGQKEFLYSRENFKFKYEFSFDAMNQLNLDTGKVRDARRRPLFISSDDIESGSFPDSFKAPPIVPTALPPGWSPWDVCNPFEFVRLPSKSAAYKDVESSFFKTMDSERFTIMDIFRVQNPQMWSAYCNEEKSMQANLERSGKEGAVVDKRKLFHGTDSLNAVRGIAINNFDFRLSGKNAAVYGAGAYFAKDAKYSHSYTENKDMAAERYMFRATVLVGEYTKGHKEHKRPPQKKSRDHELYDSCVDNEEFPTIFILYERAKYYPEYLITYRDEKAPSQSDFFLNQQMPITPQPRPRPVPKPRAVPTTPPSNVSQRTSPVSTAPTSPTSSVLYGRISPASSSSYISAVTDPITVGSSSRSNSSPTTDPYRPSGNIDYESVRRHRLAGESRDKKTECCIQ